MSKTIVKTVKKNLKKSVKSIKSVKKIASDKMVIRNSSELTNFISKSLPWMKDTGKAKDLRKIEQDPKGKGKSVIIWYGSPKVDHVTKLQVTVNLGVHPHGFVIDPAVMGNTENELKIALAVINAGRNEVIQKKTAKTAKTVKSAKIKKVSKIAEPVVVEQVAEVVE